MSTWPSNVKTWLLILIYSYTAAPNKPSNVRVHLGIQPDPPAGNMVGKHLFLKYGLKLTVIPFICYHA
jgi:hypothetical protein